MKRLAAALGILGLLCSGAWAQGRRQGGAASAAAPEEKPEEGIPVTDALVISKCGTCHTKDEKGNLTRISWERATPEGWEEAIKRMVRLNGLTLQPAEARSILKYLSTYHGLAPEEAKPYMYMAEHRIQDEVVPNDNVRSTCMTCHALGKPFSWHRSKEEWKLLTNMHVAFFPQADAAFRRPPGAMAGGGGGGGSGAAAAAAAATAGAPVAAAGASPAGQPVDQSIDFLSKSFGLHTAEWAAWRARMRTPKLAGEWLVSAHIPGRGKYFGTLTIAPGAGEAEFTTSTKLVSLADGSTITRTGTGLVYAGYSWRGRSKSGSVPAKAAPDDAAHEMREAMWFSPDQSWAEGRWFWGEYQEFGVDVRLERSSLEPKLIMTDRWSLKTGSTAQRVKLLGSGFPSGLDASDLDFGPGVTVKSIVSSTPGEIVTEVDVAANAVPGKRDVAVKRSILQSAIAVYDRIDYIKVTPESSIARLGSETHPKGYQQFEAIGYQRGEDGKIHTADDVELGPIDVNWSVEEFMAVYGDDDKEFVGSLNSTGFFTPASDGPNPARKFSRNNYGDIWVVATAKNEKDNLGKPLTGKSYLVVTVPMYIRWDTPEVAQ